MFRVGSIVFGLLFLRSVVAGEGMDQLKEFTGSLVSYSANFTQTVYDADSKPIQESSGTVVLMRPGKFAWDYMKPSPQKIVADGEKIWVYDIDLEQVTVKPLDESLGSTPMMLLGGDQPLNSQFDTQELGKSDDINWLELSPKKKDTDFEKIYMGLNENGLAAMELRDNFGQATQIRFSKVDVNGPVREDRFIFTPPAGVDVIGE